MDLLHNLISFAILMLFVWGVGICWMFRRMMSCGNDKCPMQKTCKKSTDILQMYALLITNLLLGASLVSSFVYPLVLDPLIVVCVFYTVYLTYVTLDVYRWKRQSQQCYVAGPRVIKWLP